MKFFLLLAFLVGISMVMCFPEQPEPVAAEKAPPSSCPHDVKPDGVKPEGVESEFGLDKLKKLPFFSNLMGEGPGLQGEVSPPPLPKEAPGVPQAPPKEAPGSPP